MPRSAFRVIIYPLRGSFDTSVSTWVTRVGITGYVPNIRLVEYDTGGSLRNGTKDGARCPRSLHKSCTDSTILRRTKMGASPHSLEKAAPASNKKWESVIDLFTLGSIVSLRLRPQKLHQSKPVLVSTRATSSNDVTGSAPYKSSQSVVEVRSFHSSRYLRLASIAPVM